MKIAFLCGRFGPGSCGVGDYTRRLAAQLVELGHDCVVIALCDPHVTAPISETQMEEPAAVRCHRLPESLAWRDKGRKLRDLVEYERPDLLNVQFVTYSFSRKGVPVRFYQLLRSLRNGYDFDLSIMFHELWMGVSGEVPWRQQLTGAIQRHYCLLLARLCNSGIFTNTRLHQQALRECGIDAHYLPLFGNIQCYQARCELDGELEKFLAGRALILHFGTFASASQSALETSLTQIRAAIGDTCTPVFIACGGGGAFTEENRLAAETALGPTNVRFIGRVAPQTLSELMKRATYGVNRSKQYNWEKSGVVAAMREHGLHVISYAKQAIGQTIGAEDPVTVGAVANMFIDAIKERKQ